MDVIRHDAARFVPVPLLPSFVVDTNESLRQRALRLVTLGCSQKVLATKMGMQASTFSRWLNQKDDVGPVSVAALDGFNAYVQELAEALSEQPSDPVTRDEPAPHLAAHTRREDEYTWPRHAAHGRPILSDAEAPERPPPRAAPIRNSAGRKKGR